ncbi:uncharacterized protein LOC120279941 [Dioscorea cayenensis subsp. rotundata]|uniref:Uncharacterized protein LOC120279941 n=1 Tax=Dioscorea cayennensis subsp. rotundata TaxID=55577 RepID=A0AB40CWY5_DIOCR|nr:uncharacterized protein LOC120279941 [Dioscorea cayenensis subsp. rotundata]
MAITLNIPLLLLLPQPGSFENPFMMQFSAMPILISLLLFAELLLMCRNIPIAFMAALLKIWILIRGTIFSPLVLLFKWLWISIFLSNIYSSAHLQPSALSAILILLSLGDFALN